MRFTGTIQLTFNRLVHQQAQNAADLLELVSQAPVEVMLESIDRKQVTVGKDEVIQNGPFQVFRGSAINSMGLNPDNQPSPFHMES